MNTPHRGGSLRGHAPYLVSIVLLGAFASWLPQKRFYEHGLFGQLARCAADPHCCMQLSKGVPPHQLEVYRSELRSYGIIFTGAFFLFATAMLGTKSLPRWLRALGWLSSLVVFLTHVMTPAIEVMGSSSMQSRPWQAGKATRHPLISLTDTETVPDLSPSERERASIPGRASPKEWLGMRCPLASPSLTSAERKEDLHGRR